MSSTYKNFYSLLYIYHRIYVYPPRSRSVTKNMTRLFFFHLSPCIIYRCSENEQHGRFDKGAPRRRRLIGSPASRRLEATTMDVGQNDSVAGRVIQYIGTLSSNRAFRAFPSGPPSSPPRRWFVLSLRPRSVPGVYEARKKGVQL